VFEELSCSSLKYNTDFQTWVGAWK
jgi:hypothetical protein